MPSISVPNGQTTTTFIWTNSHLVWITPGVSSDETQVSFRFYSNTAPNPPIRQLDFSLLPETFDLFLLPNTRFKFENRSGGPIELNWSASPEPPAPAFNHLHPSKGHYNGNPWTAPPPPIPLPPPPPFASTPKTYHLYSHNVRYWNPPGPGGPVYDDIRDIRVEYFDPQNHDLVAKAVMWIKHDGIVYRPAGSYLSITNQGSVMVMGNKS